MELKESAQMEMSQITFSSLMEDNSALVMAFRATVGAFTICFAA